MGKILDEALQAIGPVSDDMAARAQKRLDFLTKPQGSLGRLEEFVRRLVMITGEEMPEVPRKMIFTFVGDHGVAAEGVSAYPAEVTQQMVLNFLSGGAGINVLARHAGADVTIIDIGVDHDFGAVEGLEVHKVVSGTANMALGPAMSMDEAVRSVEVGIGLARKYAGMGYGMFGTGDMGIANTTPSSAIASVITGAPVAGVTGRGTGITDDALALKVNTIERAIKVNSPDSADPLDVLAKVGGAEIGGIAGICLGGASLKVPVVVDGFISTAGALLACELEPGTKDYLFSAHRSVEAGQLAMLEKMGLDPILQFEMRLGEGTGSALAMMMIDAGLKIYREMATFAEAGVSEEGQ